MKNERAFKGIWIPKEIWLDKNLTIMQKHFLAEIDSLDNEKGCYASNAYFAELFNLSKARCSEIISGLKEKKKYIKITYVKKDKKIEKRIIKCLLKYSYIPIRETEHPYSENTDTPIRETEHPYSENTKENNTLINNTKGDIDTSAFEFLRINYPSRFEQQFQMRYSKSIIRKKDFIEHFDNTVQIEMESKNLKWTDKSLFPRLSNFANVWVSNQKKYEQDQDTEKRVYLRKVR